MLGAISGDIIGSVYEAAPIKTTNFELFAPASTFTDDTVLTIAVASAILEDIDYATALRDFARRYPDAGYGGFFYGWMMSDDMGPYNSWGNGSAMRVSPVGFAFASPTDVLQQAELSAAVTHNHPEGIKGAQAVAMAVMLARTGSSKIDIRDEIASRFDYDLDGKLDDIRRHYEFDVSCQGTVPPAITAFLESDDVEDAIRKSVSLGGDSDTLACITGAIAHAYYKHIPESIATQVRSKLPAEFLEIIDAFGERYPLD